MPISSEIKKKKREIMDDSPRDSQKTGIRSKKARLSVTIPRWVKDSMAKWVDCEQFPSESEFTGIGLAYFLFMLEDNKKASMNLNDIKILQQQVAEIQKTLELIVKNQQTT